MNPKETAFANTQTAREPRALPGIKNAESHLAIVTRHSDAAD
jgi:hypothetical protein